MSEFGNILTSISYSKQNLFDDEKIEDEDYLPFVVNRIFSNHSDAILYVNDMNIHHDLDKKMQYDFLFGTLRKRKRFSEKHKIEKDDILESIMTFYNVNRHVAKQYKKLLNNSEIEKLNTIMNTGGIKNGKS